MIKRRTSTLVGDEGMDFIALTCSRSGAFFLPRIRQDVGIDAHLEIRDSDGKPTGAIALIQSKAGMSYISRAGEYFIRADKEHFAVWPRYRLSVIGVVYNPQKRDARWVNISAHLRSHPESIKNGPFRIVAPGSQPFSEEEFSQFQEAIEHAHVQLGSKLENDLVNDYLLGDDSGKEQALTELFAEYRWSALSCFFFHHALRIETEPLLIAYLTELISFYRHHDDRWYDAENVCPPELKVLASKYISSFGEVEVIKILSIVDPETGFERGTLGQLVAIQICAITGARHILRQIVGNRTLRDIIRWGAVAVLVEYLGGLDRAFYKQCWWNEWDIDVANALEWALDAIDEYEGPEEALGRIKYQSGLYRQLPLL